jgi:hypothetical protein
MLDVSVECQLGRIENFSITKLKTSEEVIFTRGPSNVMFEFRVTRRFGFVFLLSLFEFVFKLDRPSREHKSVKSFVFTFGGEGTGDARTQS